MHLFKYIFCSIVITLLVLFISNTMVTLKMQSYATSIDNLYKSNENAICAENDQQNFETIAENENLEYYYGEQVIDEVASNFSNPLIPSQYKIKKSDLDQAHALIEDDEMIMTVLSFNSVEKFEKVSEFFSLGQMMIGYELKVDQELNFIMISFDFENLDYYSTLFYDQKCY